MKQKRYGILDNISSPADLRGLSYDTLGVLCAALREFIVDSVSQTGGHLASNLGVVELTVAIHRVFDTATDLARPHHLRCRSSVLCPQDPDRSARPL